MPGEWGRGLLIPNTDACEPLDAECAVCDAQRATWVDKDEHPNRELTLECLDEDGQRYIVNHSDRLGAVCELAELLGCDLSDGWASSESSFAPFFIFVVCFTHRVANQIDDLPIDNLLG